MSVALGVTPTTVIVAPGVLFSGGAGFALRDAFTVDLGAAIAAVPADKSALVAILAAAQEIEDETETRTFLDATKKPTNPRDPWPTVTVATETRIVRSAIISSPVGTPDVQPALPTYGASLCLIATVAISSLGIVSVTQNTAAAIYRLDQVGADTRGLTTWRGGLDPKVQALLSTVSALALQLANLNYADQIAKLNDKIAALESRTAAGAAAVFRGADYFVNDSQSATTAAGYSARISEGPALPGRWLPRRADRPAERLCQRRQADGQRPDAGVHRDAGHDLSLVHEVPAQQPLLHDQQL